MFSSIQCINFEHSNLSVKENVPYKKIIIIENFTVIIYELFNIWRSIKTIPFTHSTTIKDKTLYIFFADEKKALEAYDFINMCCLYINSYLYDIKEYGDE